MSHDHGFKFDLPRVINRRAVLSGLASIAASGALAQELACVPASAEPHAPMQQMAATARV